MAKKKRNGKQLALDLAHRGGGALVHVGRNALAHRYEDRLAHRVAHVAVERVLSKFGRRAARKSTSPKKGQRKKMAKQPAALRAYWAKHKRGGGGAMVHHRRSAPQVKVIRVNTGGVTKHKKKKHHRGGGSAMGHIPRARKMWLAAHGGLIGYTQNVSKLELWDKIPKLGNVPKEAIVGAALEAFGLTRKHKQIDNFATAALVIGGYKAGEEGFKITGDDD